MKPIVNIFKGMVEWVSNLMKKNGAHNTVTSVLLVIIIILFLSGYADKIVKGVGEEIHEDKIEQFENHQALWVQSRELYSEVKAIMRKERPITQADYILFLEYHNGNENVATGYSFCKFDISISVRSDTVAVLPIEDFRDENIWTWDVLLNDAVMHSKMTSLSLDEALNIDPGMSARIHPNEHTQYIVFYNIMVNNICAGTMMFLYDSKEHVNWSEVTTCGSRVENTIISAMNTRNQAVANKKKK